MNIFKKCVVLSAILLTTACVTTTKIDAGPRNIGEHLQLNLSGAWNQINVSGMNGPHAETWTMEGLAIDKLNIYSGLNENETIHPGSDAARDKKNYVFKASLQPEQIVALFEGSLTRDGSTFKLLKLQPTLFGGVKGFHFEYAVIRKIDNVEILGTANVAISRNQLYAMVYQAPKLVFYSRHIERVNQIMQSARIS
ncbi:hypothetical protein [Undibacterium curvum]|uniref:Uncharacterized protein n=1 Tax=Undibacterium curvum TaxID=2762294 RepID=A0ABR7A5P0_9BURK|nr:hypothetical protein [Undibacterium curvum]MBC3932215.1 hypothetical protein [Undibacterium curvum]